MERIWVLLDTLHSLMLPVECPGFLPLSMAVRITPGVIVFEFKYYRAHLVCMIAYQRFELGLADVSGLDRLTGALGCRIFLEYRNQVRP
jgi:hypothetical protein